jgi:hypothetical protein
VKALKRTVRQVWMKVFRHHPYEYLGRAWWLGPIVRLLPRSYVENVERGVFTGRGGLMGAVIRGELERQYYASPDEEKKQRVREFWAGESGRAWHEAKQSLYTDSDRFEREYLPFRQDLVQALTVLTTSDSRFDTLCEIGTGNGMFLRYLSERLGGVRRFVGIDLSREQIDANRRAYAGTKLEFEDAEALEWIDREAAPGTVFVACGTLECLTASELEQLLRRIASRATPGAFGIVEPISFDLDTATESRPRGAMMFSHNYPRLFEACGFSVRNLKTTAIDPRKPLEQNVSMLAVCGL